MGPKVWCLVSWSSATWMEPRKLYVSRCFKNNLEQQHYWFFLSKRTLKTMWDILSIPSQKKLHCPCTECWWPMAKNLTSSLLIIMSRNAAVISRHYLLISLFSLTNSEANPNNNLMMRGASLSSDINIFAQVGFPMHRSCKVKLCVKCLQWEETRTNQVKWINQMVIKPN